MTLTKSPCDLDTMSLFQDLKLKRRKVDSRCSSDGESVADTSASSPDMAGPASPCKLELARSSPSPGTVRDRVASPDSVLPELSGDERPLSRGMAETKAKGGDELTVRVFDGGGGNRRESALSSPPTFWITAGSRINGDMQDVLYQETMRPPASSPQRTVIVGEERTEGSDSVITGEIKENQSAGVRELVAVSSAASFWVTTGSTALSRVDGNIQEGLYQETMRPPAASPQRSVIVGESVMGEDRTENKSAREVKGGDHSAGVREIAVSSAAAFWASTGTTATCRVNVDVQEFLSGALTESVKPPAPSPQRSPASRTSSSVIMGESVNSEELHEHCREEGKVKVKEENEGRRATASPSFWVATSRSNGVMSELVGNYTDAVKTPVSSPQRFSVGSNQAGSIRASPTVIMGETMTSEETQEHCGEEGKATVKYDVEGRREPASVSTSPPAFWLASSRINGVMPELIGGSDTMKPPVSSPQRFTVGGGAAGAVRAAPTVIMGEAGGVRTMVWSLPATTFAEPAQSTSTSTCWSSSSVSSPSSASNSEESAAQLLLNLGQERAFRTPTSFPMPLNMERLWAGDLTQLPSSQQLHALNLTTAWPATTVPSTLPASGWLKNGETPEDADEEDQPMICMICEDKATGLHYGIITCEGCKGFFKRTVQNRRVYTCVADGVCEITKAQRNRCQYCRFKKCIEQGMVLQAVREDRMPGGRNSGAVYNLYKVKYKKHKKNARNGQIKPQTKISMTSEHGIPPHLVNGTILKTALTNPKEVVHLRQRLDNAVSSSRDTTLTLDSALATIQLLIDCDDFQDIATVQNLEDLLEHKTDLSDRLMQIGDSIVYKLVQWTKKLPFYLELPVEVHTKLLTHKWHELLVLTTSAYQAIHGQHKTSVNPADPSFVDFTQEVSKNLSMLQTCLTSMMGRTITLDQLRQDVGHMVEKITHVTLIFRRIKLRIEEYVLLKVIIMLNPATRGGANELEAIQERYMNCLKTYVEYTAANQPNRFHELLLCLPEVQTAASLLLESKMFYVPFLLNSAIQR